MANLRARARAAPPRVRDGARGARGAGRRSPARPDLAGPLSPAVVLRLQRDAGNRAVSAFLAVQRDVPDDLTPRLTQARTQVEKGDFDDAIWDSYRGRGGSIAGVAERLWLDQLVLADVDPDDRAMRPGQRRAAQALVTALRARVGRTLLARFTALRGDVARSGTKIKDQVDAAMNAAPMWTEGTVADRLWEQWVGSFALGRDAPSGAADLWSALRTAGAPAVKAKRDKELAKAEVAALDSAEVSAVESALDRTNEWVVTPDQMIAVTDQVAAALSRPAAHTDAAWIALNGRMARLIQVAEVNLINRTIPQGTQVWPARWAEFRNRYVATTSKPIWIYYRDNIVDAVVLGTAVRRKDPGGGVHRDVAAALPLVEQSAMRLGGFSSVDELRRAPAKRTAPAGALHGGNPIALPGTEFRFEAVSHPDWMGRATHLSFHGTGRAIDFRSSTNPAIQGPVHELISVLGNDELSELPATSYRQRSDLAGWAGREATVLRMRAELVARLKAETDPDQRKQLAEQVMHIDEALGDAPQTNRAAAVVRDRVTETFHRIEAIELDFQLAWDALRAASPTDAELVTQLLEAVDRAAATAADELKKAKDAKAANVGEIDQRVKRIAELRARLADTRTQSAILAQADAAAQSGLSDLPLWLVQAFTEHGWQWGEWPGFSDAMHFDYMGPVADVISQ
jgi:hypothetical protein